MEIQSQIVLSKKMISRRLWGGNLKPFVGHAAVKLKRSSENAIEETQEANLKPFVGHAAFKLKRSPVFVHPERMHTLF